MIGESSKRGDPNNCRPLWAVQSPSQFRGTKMSNELRLPSVVVVVVAISERLTGQDSAIRLAPSRSWFGQTYNNNNYNKHVGWSP